MDCYLCILVFLSAAVITATGDEAMFFYEIESTSTPQPTTPQPTTNTPEPETTTTEGDETGHHSTWRDDRIRGSEEMKVFFRDCSFYSKDSMFGGPVCASDKKTYPNFMFMECLNCRKHPKDRVRVLHGGPCWSNPGHGLCPMDPVYSPVCGTDNKTYKNELALKCEAKKPGKHHLMVKYKGDCETDQCHFGNYTWEKPVCISNGRTVQSYQAVICLRSLGSDVQIVHDGPCTGRDLQCILKDQNHICHRMLNEVEPYPVCGSDGVTYPNAAEVICSRPHLTIEFDRPCDSPEYFACREAERLDKEGKCKPVCGSDGKNYNTKHHLNCAKIIKSYLKMQHEGMCVARDTPCMQLYNEKNLEGPVCGSDGVSYVSPYALECVAKYKKPSIEFRHSGPCLRRY